MENKLMIAGKIINTHSLRGEVRIYPYCDSAEFICEFDYLYINNVKTEVINARVHKGQALVKFNGIDSIDKAEALIGQNVYFDKNDVELDEGQYFIEDIKGLEVYDIDTDEYYGKVINVIETGANDVFEIKLDDKIRLIPKIDDVIKEISIDDNKILIRPLKGLFE